MELAEALTLVVFYSGAFLMPLLASRVHVPAAVAEIVFGLAIGAAGIVHQGPATAFLAELGFIYLMFLVGMEIDFNRIEREGRKTVLIAFLVATLILILAAYIAERLDMPPFMALVIGAMSVGVLMVALVESDASKTRWGQILLLVGSIGEFLTLLTLTGYDLVHQHGVGSELAAAALRVILLFVVALALLATMRLAVWWFPHSFQRWVREEDPSELGVRFGFVLMLGLTALAAWVGLESIIGAFLAGILFAYIFRETGVLETKLVALGQGFFVPIFFINVGVTFEWAALGDVSTLGRALLVLGAASLVAKFVPSVLLLLLGLRVRTVVAGAFMLATPLTLLVAIAALGREIQVIDAATSAAVILLAIVTGVIFPTLFKLIAPKRPQKQVTPENALALPPEIGASVASPE
jgi:Kef-type K+ transport system membrane component KefB